MNEILGLLVRHGPAVLFIAVFIEQIGVPLPAAPWLLAAGALAGAGKINGLVALVAAALGAILADVIWFLVGRRIGRRVLDLICRISLEPDSCARRTQNLFARYGMRGVVAAKFIPGLSSLAAPLAGSSGMGAARFFFFDGLGAALYAGSFILVGVLFSRQIEQIMNALAGLGHSAFALAIGSAVLYIGYKYFQRRRLLSDLRMARITVDELHQKQEAGENLIVLDLRSQGEVERDPVLIRGALHMTLEEVPIREQEIPRDRDIILYCSCPNEVTSARVALLLHRKGIVRVRPLLGGIDAWRERNYPTDLRGGRVADQPDGISAIQENRYPT
ncbi:MAG TPA: VTT domain-containing protein [Verrucomicrobiota bacterium]|nr:sulfurtransferase [Verrucomicrobiales bacterium]HRI11873.1 VTT domain-containing protein [Verrucomicrobiota bacterium]